MSFQFSVVGSSQLPRNYGGDSADVYRGTTGELVQTPAGLDFRRGALVQYRRQAVACWLMQDFRKLHVWERAHQLALDVRSATHGFPSGLLGAEEPDDQVG